MEKLIFIWLCLGLYGYWLDQIRVKEQYETPISFVRGVFAGLITVIFVGVAMIATPANEFEDRVY